MKITNSAVAMSGNQSYSHYQETRVSTTQMTLAQWRALQEQNAKKDAAADVSISDESRKKLADEQAKQKESSKNPFEDILKSGQSEQIEPDIRVESKDEQMLKTLQKILEMLKNIHKNNKYPSGFVSWSSASSLQKADSRFSSTMSRLGKAYSMTQSILTRDLRSSSQMLVTGSSAGSAFNTTTWVRHTEKSGFVMEQENTTFSATGVARTSDGREIEFNVDLQMSRAFAGAFFSSWDEQVVLTDPLVINLDSDTATVSDQKFYFDLDADGVEEEISFLGSGSGFLAYDKNNDGVINDGSELFGTRSGDGFADLAKYDEDGNGWIDENDSIFNDLKIWIKDEDGNDRLLSLKEANVGAIYLGSVNTQFHLNDAETNQTNGVIQKTGVFLHETGEVGTIQHVDLAV